MANRAVSGGCGLLALGILGAAVAAAPSKLQPPAPLDSNDAYLFIDYFFNEPTMLGHDGQDPAAARLGFLDDGVRVDKRFAPFVQSYDGIHLHLENDVIAWSADKQVAWASADDVNRGGGMGGPTPPGWFGDWHHGAVVLVPHGKNFRVVAYSVRTTVPDSDQAAALAAGALPPKLARKIDHGAEDAAKQFEATVGDPAAFAASVSDRADVVLFGSSRTDRAVGGKQVADALTKWGLKLKVRDGVQAGLAGPTVAWVAANVDAVPAGAKAGTKPTPYQLLVVYETTGGAWKIVQASFAFFAQAP